MTDAARQLEASCEALALRLEPRALVRVDRDACADRPEHRWVAYVGVAYAHETVASVTAPSKEEALARLRLELTNQLRARAGEDRRVLDQHGAPL